MKKLLLSLSAVALFACTGFSQVLNTNTSPPTLSGPFVDFMGALTTATNWGLASGGIYAPKADNGKGTAGAFAVALYNLTPWLGTGIGIDWLEGGDVTMPSAQIQFQAPLRIGGTNGVTLRPFAFTGVATPVAGKGEDNGTVVGLIGAGIGVKVWKGFNLFYGIEQRTGENGPWHLFGAAYSLSF